MYNTSVSSLIKSIRKYASTFLSTPMANSTLGEVNDVSNRIDQLSVKPSVCPTCGISNLLGYVKPSAYPTCGISLQPR